MRAISRLAAYEDALQAVFARQHERLTSDYRLAQTNAAHAYLTAWLICVLALAGTAAYIVHVRRRVLRPVELLGHVMRVVSEDHNYTHRAYAYGHPAVIHAAGAFDEMMAGIQASFERVATAAPAVVAPALSITNFPRHNQSEPVSEK